MANVLFITHWFPDAEHPINGIFIQEQARAVSFYHNVNILHVQGVYPSEPRMKVETDGEFKLKIFRLRYPRPLLPKTGWIYRLLGAERIFRHLVRHDFHPDLIHAHIYSAVDLAVFLGALHRLPVLLSEHASVFPRRLLTGFQAHYYRFFMNRVKIILPTSNYLQDHLRGFGVRTPLQTVSNAIDTRRFFYAPRTDRERKDAPLTVLCVARLNPEKAVDVLLQAFAVLLKDFPDCRLWIVGEGPERLRLQQMARQLKIEQHATFWGLKSGFEVAELMRQADLFVLTSRWETQGVVLLEAMACGLPVVAPAIGGIPEVVQSFCGQLVSVSSASEYARCLADVLTNLDQYSAEQISNYAHQHFSFQAIGKQLSEIYLRILQDRMD